MARVQKYVASKSCGFIVDFRYVVVALLGHWCFPLKRLGCQCSVVLRNCYTVIDDVFLGVVGF